MFKIFSMYICRINKTQRLEVNDVVRPIYELLGFKGIANTICYIGM
jgi:hypothetical protein